MKKVDLDKLAAIRASMSGITKTIKEGATGSDLQNSTIASGEVKMAGERSTPYLDKIAEEVAKMKEKSPQDPQAQQPPVQDPQQQAAPQPPAEPEPEISPEEEQLIQHLAAQGMDENQIMEVLARIEQETAMLEQAQEAQADAVVEQLSAQGLAPEQILEFVAANAEQEAMAEAQQDQLAAMHGYVPSLDKQAGIWTDTLKRITAPYKQMAASVRGTGMKNMMTDAAGVAGAKRPLRKAGADMLGRGWNAGGGDWMSRASMAAPAGVAGVAGGAGIYGANQPDPSWYDRFAAMHGSNPYLDKMAGISGRKIMNAVTAPVRDMASSYGRNFAQGVNLPMKTKIQNVLRAGWHSNSPYRNLSKGIMAGVPVAGVAGAGYAAMPQEQAPWYSPEGIRDMLSAYNGYNPYMDLNAYNQQGNPYVDALAYNNGYNPYLDKMAADTNPYLVGGGSNAAMAAPLAGGMSYAATKAMGGSPRQRALAAALGVGIGGLMGAGSGSLGTWLGGKVTDAYGKIPGAAVGYLTGGIGGAAGAYNNESNWYDGIAASNGYNPYLDKTAANWGAGLNQAWQGVKGFGQQAGQFLGGLPQKAMNNPWATAGIGTGLAALGAGAYGMANQEPTPDDQEFLAWLLNTPEGQQYLTMAAGGLGGAALGAGAGYAAGGGMGAGIGAGLGALGGGYAGYQAPEWQGQY